MKPSEQKEIFLKALKNKEAGKKRSKNRLDKLTAHLIECGLIRPINQTPTGALVAKTHKQLK